MRVLRDNLNECAFAARFSDAQFYACAMLNIDGSDVGILCVADDKRLEEEQFGDKEISLLVDFAHIAADLVKERCSSQLNSLCETLVMNANLLKLLSLPLQNILKSRAKIADFYSEILSVHRRAETSITDKTSSGGASFRDMVSFLAEEVSLFAEEVSRFTKILSKLTQLFSDIYGLDHTDSLTLPSGGERLLFRSLMEVDFPRIQSLLGEFCQPLKSSKSPVQSSVTVSWLDETISAFPRPVGGDYISSGAVIHSIYSFPVVFQLVVAVLYDSLDYFHCTASITIQSTPAEPDIEFDFTVVPLSDSSLFSTRIGKWRVECRMRASDELVFKKLVESFVFLSKMSDCSLIQGSEGDDILVLIIEIPYYEFNTSPTAIQKSSKPSDRIILSRDDSDITKESHHDSSPSKASLPSLNLSFFRFLQRQWNRRLAVQRVSASSGGARPSAVSCSVPVRENSSSAEHPLRRSFPSFDWKNNKVLPGE